MNTQEIPQTAGKEIVALLLQEKGHQITPELESKIQRLQICYSLQELIEIAKENEVIISKSEQIFVRGLILMLGSTLLPLEDNVNIVLLNPLTRKYMWHIHARKILHELQHVADELTNEFEVENQGMNYFARSMILMIIQSALMIAVVTYPELDEELAFKALFHLIIPTTTFYCLFKYYNNVEEKSARRSEKLASRPEFKELLDKMK